MADGVRPGTAGEERRREATAPPEGDSVPPGLPRAAAAGTDPAEERRRRWLAENAEAIEANNAWVEANGLPLEAYRLY